MPATITGATATADISRARLACTANRTAANACNAAITAANPSAVALARYPGGSPRKRASERRNTANAVAASATIESSPIRPCRAFLISTRFS